MAQTEADFLSKSRIMGLDSTASLSKIINFDISNIVNN